MFKKLLMTLTCAAALSAVISSVASADDEGSTTIRGITVYCYCNTAIHLSKKGCTPDHHGALCAAGENIICSKYQTNCQ